MKELTKVEEEVMQIIWKLQKGFVKDFIAAMEYPQPPYNTISSVVRLLEKKGFVAYKAYGKTHEYFPIISHDHYRSFAAKKLLNQHFAGSVENLFSFFAQKEGLSLDDLEAIALKLKDLKSKDND